ncbi:HTTM domain-containing protein [Aeromicrobium wangtongii]|uniref:HTTM domain-containing protein n=1 Tax=Aeromicrobium wangtongii TaxID=2969247 RepID=A0ABY5MCR5_9ACTN|nr:HTTM domain-containing protein [Aeromicrobium wangtongii]MCD9197290.1 HTTM domain-containing protein [Aeromicrobium wangtongii]UUP14785.1 HTTM domain-containing protein [Aeromicrobium wangtongii]
MIARAMGWLTDEKHSTYGLSVTRMILGFIVASQLIVNWPDRHYTWGDGSRWTDEVLSSRGWPSFLGMFTQLGGVAFDLAYLATIGFGVLMMLGLYTRASSFMTLLLWVSLYVSNPFVGSGGDAILRMVLLYMCLTDSGRHWSLDARRRSRREQVRLSTGSRAGVVPAWMSNTLHNLGIILIVHQVVMVYLGSSFWKVQSPVWKDGTAVYYPLQTDAYSPWHDVLQPLYANATLIAGATYAAVLVQMFFPVLLLYRPTRFLALIAVTGMHLGIGLLMGIMYFSLVMIAVDMILVSDGSWERAQAWLRARRRGVVADPPPTTTRDLRHISS